MLDRATEQKLLNLVADLDRFAEEKRFPSGLNIFEAVGLYRHEIRHSNFLAFLLRPQESHGLGDGFLKRLLQKITDNLSVDSPISPLSIVLNDFSDALVSREQRNIDLLIESRNNDLVLVVENKVDASEGENQLLQYRELIQSEFPTERKLFCYLTPNGELPSDDFWVSLSYSEVVDALEQAKSHNQSKLTQEAEIVVNHYINLIRRHIVPDPHLIEQCRKLYELHKDAFELVFRYGKVNTFDAATNRFFENHPELTNLLIRPGSAVAFLPNSFFEVLPGMDGINWWGQSRPFLFWFNQLEDKLGLVLEVGPFTGDKFDRSVLAQQLLNHFKNKNKIYPKFTRVYTEYKRLTEDQSGDPEEVHAIMEALYKNVATKHLLAITEILSKFFSK